MPFFLEKVIVAVRRQFPSVESVGVVIVVFYRFCTWQFLKSSVVFVLYMQKKMVVAVDPHYQKNTQKIENDYNN